MKLRSLLAVAALATSFGASAQTWVSDSVTMGAGYANDVWYSMKNGQQKTNANGNWHLAFQMTPQGPYGNVSIFANHATTPASTKVYSLHMQASAKFASLTAADTAGKTGTQLYNADSSWNYGAFNQMPSNTPFDYSWGVYDLNSHYVNGDSLYLIKTDTGTSATTYKVWIKQYVSTPSDSVKWIFRIAQWDNTGDTTVTLHQKDYPNRLFAYYDAKSRTASDREPARNAWDVLFSRYISMIPTGPTTVAAYPVTGVMSNFGVNVAVAHNVNADTTHYQNYAFSNNMTAIGSDWKTFNMTTFTYDVDTARTYFVKSSNTNEYWQIQFTRFASASGKSVFRKRLVATIPTAINNVVNNSISNYYASPNPANNQVTLMVDTRDAAENTTLALVDMSGRVVMQQPVSINRGVNAFTVNTANIPTGMYLLALKGSNLMLTQKISIAH